ncbi:hypothetical protein BG015_002176 [Linnemannia schmuckeri]|uniref:Uncharacterized protein n=1 Tax=Linnemannia schmuckeri TaxID=64567 RepID=A0A9P5S3I0_9FUNG|nr:hypothetical protein BG015_002176 [Linnemannia schmuckeri]
MTFTQALWRSLPTTTSPLRPLLLNHSSSSTVSVSGTAVPAMALRRISASPRLTATPTSTTTAATPRRPFHNTPMTKNTTSIPESPAELESKAPSIGKSPVIKPLSRKPRNSRNTRWTPELDEKLLELRKGNRTWESISHFMGRSTSACSDRYYTALDPALRNWTPAMFAKLNQMVEDGAKWSDIAIALDAKIVACQNQWRTLGNGKYRIKGIITTSQSLSWTPYEMDAFWAAWIRLGKEAAQDSSLSAETHKLDWKEFAAEVKTKTAVECRKAFKLLVNHALKDAPGWVKLETVSYVSETIKAARARKRLELKEKRLKDAAAAGEALNLDDEDLEDDEDDESAVVAATGGAKETRQKLTTWTDEEHKALFEAVERYGLFSGWTKIRNEVKPDVNDEDVEIEYYHVSGIQEKPKVEEQSSESETIEIVSLEKGTKIHGEWTDKEAARLSLVLMKYSHMPIWAERAQEMGVTPTEEDYDILFKNNREHPIKRLSKKELKALEAARDGKRKVRGRGKKFLLQEAADAAKADTEAMATMTTLPAVQEPTRAIQETIASTTTATHPYSDNNNEDEDPNEQGTGLLWNADRTLRLRRLVGQQQLQERSGHSIDWSWIAEHIGPGFDASTCITKWQSLPEHSSIKVEPARFWDEADIRLLEQGILTHGNQWTFIQRDFLPERTTDSIRRKVSNLQKKREHLIRDARATAVALKEKYPDLDVEETVKTAIVADESCVLWGRLNDLLKQYRDNPKNAANSPKRRDFPSVL